MTTGRRLAVVATASVIFFATASVAGAHIPRLNCNSTLTPKAELACARVNAAHALGAIRWAQHQPQLATYDVSESGVRLAILRDHQWLYQVMISRIAEAKRRLAFAAYPPHHALWTCIGSYEGSPTSINPSGHYGMLQMHADWGYGTSHHASDDPQVVQEWAAERAYRASGYSQSFLYGQWLDYDGATSCLRYAY